MKKFETPGILVLDLTPSESILDDITLSQEQVFIGEEIIVTDTSDEAVW